MLYKSPFPAIDPLRQIICDYYRKDESRVVEELLQFTRPGAAGRARVWNRARELVVTIRKDQVGKGGVDALLKEFALSTEEGIVLMCLAEALLRVPDKLTTDRLIRDKLVSGDWASHLGNSDSLFVNASAWGLLLTGKVVGFSDEDLQPQEQEQIGILKQTINRLGEPVIRTSVRYAMQVMGTQFVMGKVINSAIKRARKQEAKGYRYSYDMLGEGARTADDADRYFKSYMDAVEAIGKAAKNQGPILSPGISVKLSALRPRYEFSHRERVMNELVPRLKTLAMAARDYKIGFTVDAEEADKLDLSLDVIEAVFSDPDLDGWDGFGLAIQAYQKRALYVVEWVRAIAAGVGRKMMVRLVKGAYWDSEIKWSQVDGYSDYPVFTRKAATDVCYQACALKLLENRDVIYPQFATHNAYTVATILEMDDVMARAAEKDTRRQGYEFQRLHGMGEALFNQILEDEALPCRIYAPVGEHADLLAYLVRRLLENGANSSFVNNVVDESIPIESLLEDPIETARSWAIKRNSAIPLPLAIYQDSEWETGNRQNSKGVDLTDLNILGEMQENMYDWWENRQSQQPLKSAGMQAVLNPANQREVVGYIAYDQAEQMADKLEAASRAFAAWSATPAPERANLLRKLADKLEANRDSLIALCVKEAGKTIADSISEVREAVDFCRYYADRAEELTTGKQVKSRGVILCISPWNFPLAIFLGQVSAALVTGNTVIAKPAEQTSLVAIMTINLMVECGFPEYVVQLVIAPGKPAGEQLVPDDRVQGVMFTGSTATGRWLSSTLSLRQEPGIPLIAETGGQNAMIVDSTALPEQVVDDVISSGFQSAGQRCSACRILFLQEEIAPQVITMLKGAMSELSIGDPALLSTDVGPVIDEAALSRLESHCNYLDEIGNKSKLLHQCELPEICINGHFFAPRLYEITELAVLKEEVFGPIVHVIRYAAEKLDSVIEQINATGYGLTLGVHTRIQSVATQIARRANVGNIYINRNMIGAAVGVQPFGGMGLSGTGPKAGGPHYLRRLIKSWPEKPVPEQIDPHPLKDSSDPQKSTGNVIGKAILAQSSWAATTILERESVVRRFLSHIVNESGSFPQDKIDDLLADTNSLIGEAEIHLAQPATLPGPTGESNNLFLESRGLIALVIDKETSPSEILKLIFATLLAGNTMILFADLSADNKFNDYANYFIKSGLPQHMLFILPIDSARSVLPDAGIHGVLLPAASRWVKFVQHLLATSEGALVPLIQESDNQQLLIRLVVEKTVTIDTTAAGGNASLMAAAG